MMMDDTTIYCNCTSLGNGKCWSNADVVTCAAASCGKKNCDKTEDYVDLAHDIVCGVPPPQIDSPEIIPPDVRMLNFVTGKDYW